MAARKWLAAFAKYWPNKDNHSRLTFSGSETGDRRPALKLWLVEHNSERPYESLGDISPIESLIDQSHASHAWY